MVSAFHSSTLPDSGSPIPVSILMASPACQVPTMPGNTPSTPASAQFGASPAGGGDGNRQR